jgi:hypothetical protein
MRVSYGGQMRAPQALALVYKLARRAHAGDRVGKIA